VFVWSFFSNNIPWQYIAIRIVIRLSGIAIYHNTLLPYRDTPTYPPARGKNKQAFKNKIASAGCMDEKHNENLIYFIL
jgi:hypothetical protein